MKKFLAILIFLTTLISLGWSDTEPNGTCATAETVSMSSLSTLQGNLQPNGQNDNDDYYKFTADTSGNLSLTVSVTKNSTLYLYGSLLGVCNVLDVKGSSTSSSSLTLSNIPITAGETYFLRLKANTNGSNTYSSTASIIPQSSPSADYRLDECSWNGTTGEVKDNSGNNHGTSKSNTASATTVATTTDSGKIYRGGEFKGYGFNADPYDSWYDTQYYVDISDTSALSPIASTKAMSITGWFKLNNTNDQTILHKGNGTSQEYRVFIENNQLKFTVWNQYSSPSTITINTFTPIAGQYYFFAATAQLNTATNQLTMKIYLKNGSNTYSKITTFNSFVYQPSTPGNLYIGAVNWGSLSGFFNGTIDEIKVFNSALSETFINQIYNNESSGTNYDGSTRNAPQCSNLLVPIADYRFDECNWNGTTSEVKDTSGNNLHGTAQGTAQISTDSIINLSGVFDNSTSNNAAISIPDNNLLSPHVGTNGEITVSAWVKLNAYPTSALQGRIPIVAKGDNNNWEYALYIYQDHRAGFSVWQSSGSSYKEISGGNLALNTWYHITGVLKKGSFARVYVNGNLIVESTSGFSGTTTNGTSPLYIARRGSGNNYLNGYIDEAKIFAKAFTQTEVQSVYSNEQADKNYDGTSRTASCCCLPSGGNLIANPSFETLCQSTIIQTWNNVSGGTVNMRNNVCGWTMNGTGMETWENTTLKPASNGTIFVEIDGYSTTVDRLSQNLNTANGVHYVISFDYRARNGGSDRIIAKWNGTEVGTFNGITTGWQTAQIEVVGTGSDILAFEEPSADNNSYGSWIDNIRVAEGTLATNCTSFTYEPYHSYNASLTPSYRLHTRISQQPFDLNVTVACAGSGTIPARKIKNIYAIDGTATSCNAATPKLFTLLSNGTYDINDTNKIITIPNLNITKAYSNIKLMLETNSSEFNCSSDNFVIRPPSFSITSPIPSTKATTFTLQISANNSGSGYNGTANVTTGLQVPNSNCPVSSGFLTSSLGTTEPLTLSFQNDSNSSTTKATDVGTIYLNTKSTTWTTIDQPNDCIADNNTTTINTQGFVGCNIENNLSLNITPDHFDVNATLTNFGGGTFTYLSTDLTMSGQLDLNITAKNGENNTTKNYTAGCYSKDTTVTLPHSTVPSPLTKILYHDSITLTDTNITKANPITSTYTASKFTQGLVSPRITFNFDRNSFSPLSPFDFNITSATATDTDGVDGNDTTVGSAKFVYGRARSYDIATNTSPIDVPIEFEVYSTTSGGFVSGMPQNVLKWYRNLDHNTSAEGHVIQGGYNAGGNDIDASAAPANGLQTVTVTSTQDRTIHLDISPWLWYSLNPLKTYNYGTDCTQHPCFHYDFTDTTTGVQGVNSGTFQGSDFQMTPAKNITNKGVKLFR